MFAVMDNEMVIAIAATASAAQSMAAGSQTVRPAHDVCEADFLDTLAGAADDLIYWVYALPQPEPARTQYAGM